MRFLVSTAVVLAVTAGVALSSAAHPGPAHTGRLELLASTKKPVTVKGVPLAGLYPGASRTLTAMIKNPNSGRIKIATIKTKVTKTSIAGCSTAAQNLTVTVTHPKAGLKIAPKKSAKLVLAVMMPTSVADACQGAKFTISITIRAIKG
ncbi:MAG TPA: hypothetical protein VGL44_01830 [Gaiellales bacterium]|jgi:hypothetical protein